MKIILAVLAVAAVLVSGCVSTNQVGGGLTVRMRASPDSVFSSGTTVINIDFSNDNNKAVRNVDAVIFDAGVMSFADEIAPGSACRKYIEILRPNQMASFSCTLAAPDASKMPADTLRNMVSARISYNAEFSAAQIVELMTEGEYQNRRAVGSYVQKPKSYSYRDDNVQMDIEFSDYMPLIVRDPGQKEYYMSIKIKNVGNGIIGPITRDSLRVVQAKTGGVNIDDVVTCPYRNDLSWRVEPISGEFPVVRCRINLPEGVTAIENYGILVVLDYNYEVREETTITIVK